MTVMLSEAALTQIRGAGLDQPRLPLPGQKWKPVTAAERHLLREAYRLDRVRQVLLNEVDRLRSKEVWPPLEDDAAAAEATALAAPQPRECPLTPRLLDIVRASAAGLSLSETAQQLAISDNTVRVHRRRLVARLGARSLTQAVAVCVAEGWISGRQIAMGVAS